VLVCLCVCVFVGLWVVCLWVFELDACMLSVCVFVCLGLCGLVAVTCCV